jgi:DUF4097 and DUF4098 domain-containing protein YvlB
MCRTTARFILAAVLAAAAATPLAAQEPSTASPHRHGGAWYARTWAESAQAKAGPEQSEKISKTFRLGPNGVLDISNVSGNISVREAAGDAISVEAIKHVRTRDAADGKAQLAAINVTMTERGNRVEVRTSYPTNQHTHASVDYVVTAPAGSSVYAKSVSGNVDVTGIRGELRAESVSGDVKAIDTANASQVKSVSGDVEVTGVTSKDDLTVSSVSGDITLQAVKARNVDTDTVSGELKLNDVACERLSGKSISGSVVFLGPLSKNGRYELKSHSGDIRLTMTADTGFELEAQSFSGNIRSDLPVTVRGGETISQAGRHNTLRGVHGDGGALLLLTSFSGNITVAKK